MTLRVEKRDLFTVDESYYLVHCISADFALGAGIAKEINERFNMRDELRAGRSEYLEKFSRIRTFPFKPKKIGNWYGDMILCGRVYNLVTKERYFQKPTYNSMDMALDILAFSCSLRGVKKIAMPKIGCGLDKLKWSKVEKMIEKYFDGLDIEILVCEI